MASSSISFRAACRACHSYRAVSAKLGTLLDSEGMRRVELFDPAEVFGDPEHPLVAFRQSSRSFVIRELRWIFRVRPRRSVW
jgi:hypothetical protein